MIGTPREAEVVVAKGSTMAEACRQIGVTEQTLYRGRREYGGMKVDQARRMKELATLGLRLLLRPDFMVQDPPGLLRG